MAVRTVAIEDKRMPSEPVLFTSVSCQSDAKGILDCQSGVRLDVHQLLDAYFRKKRSSLFGETQSVDGGVFSLERELSICGLVGRVHLPVGMKNLSSVS